MKKIIITFVLAASLLTSGLAANRKLDSNNLLSGKKADLRSNFQFNTKYFLITSNGYIWLVAVYDDGNTSVTCIAPVNGYV